MKQLTQVVILKILSPPNYSLPRSKTQDIFASCCIHMDYSWYSMVKGCYHLNFLYSTVVSMCQMSEESPWQELSSIQDRGQLRKHENSKALWYVTYHHALEFYHEVQTWECTRGWSTHLLWNGIFWDASEAGNTEFGKTIFDVKMNGAYWEKSPYLNKKPNRFLYNGECGSNGRLCVG